MIRSFACAIVAAAAAGLGSTTAVHAEIVTTLTAGEGANLSTIQIDFSNGNGYVIEYRWDGAATGFSALVSLQTLLPEFTLVYEDTAFGPLVNGLGVLGDYEFGTGDLWPEVENYWHYWLKDSGDWSWAPIGAGARQLFNGSFDGWVFGSPAAPQPIPSPAGVVVGVLVMCGLRRRRNTQAFDGVTT
ncbi:MAG: hypothetical protein KF724_08850 [Phycisphaeraceae bacterium]|nr:hypothetical protein [Phycisphaeraceae bacterium]